MTTEELAECLGVAKQTVNRWIRETGWKTEKFPGVKGGRARLILVDTSHTVRNKMLRIFVHAIYFLFFLLVSKSFNQHK